MAVSAKLYSNFPLNAIKALITDMNAAGTAIKVALCTSAYTPNQETHTVYTDLTNEVANGNGYATGGATLANKAVTEATRRTKFDADDAAWTAATFTARYAVIYDSSSATKKLIAYVDFGADVSPSNSTLTITWDATGIFGWTVPA